VHASEEEGFVAPLFGMSFFSLSLASFFSAAVEEGEEEKKVRRDTLAPSTWGKTPPSLPSLVRPIRSSFDRALFACTLGPIVSLSPAKDAKEKKDSSRQIPNRRDG
jgi:hypothetical protein